ncbi:hypothetical protein [Dactylosporangium cerinum]
MDQLPFSGDTVLASPLISGERVLGAIIMSWADGLPDGDELRRYVAALLEPVARQIDTLIGDEIASAWFHVEGEESAQAAPAQVWLPTVVDVLHNPAALLSPVTVDGQLVDFRVEYANVMARQVFTAARVDPDEATLLAAYPTLGSTTLLPEFARMLQDGQPRRLEGLRADPRTDGCRRRRPSPCTPCGCGTACSRCGASPPRPTCSTTSCCRRSGSPGSARSAGSCATPSPAARRS